MVFRNDTTLAHFLQHSGLRPAHVTLHAHADISTNTTWHADFERLFAHSPVRGYANVVAQALSHYHVHKHVAGTRGQMHAVFEDSVQLADGWMERWNTEYHAALPTDAYVT